MAAKRRGNPLPLHWNHGSCLRPLPVERLKLLVFDLDGTLIDSAQDLCNSVNATLTQFGREPLPDAAIAGYIGNGALMLVRRALLGRQIAPDEVDEELLAKAYAFFLDYYREHKLDYTYAYEGVLEALAALATLHDAPGGTPRAMAVLTNKPVRPARGICEALGLAPLFPAHLWRQQLYPQKARSDGPARADGGGRRTSRRDSHDRRQPGGRADGAQRRRLVDRLDRFKTQFISVASRKLRDPLLQLRRGLYALGQGFAGELQPLQAEAAGGRGRQRE